MSDRPVHGRTHARVAEPPPRRPTRSIPAPPWIRGLVALLLMALVVTLVLWTLP